MSDSVSMLSSFEKLLILATTFSFIVKFISSCTQSTSGQGIYINSKHGGLYHQMYKLTAEMHCLPFDNQTAIKLSRFVFPSKPDVIIHVVPH